MADKNLGAIFPYPKIRKILLQNLILHILKQEKRLSRKDSFFFVYFFKQSYIFPSLSFQSQI